MESVSNIDGQRSSCSKDKTLGEVRKSEKFTFIQWRDIAGSRICNWM